MCVCVLSQVEAVKDVLAQLPSENLALIRVMVELLKQVSVHVLACVHVCARDVTLQTDTV